MTRGLSQILPALNRLWLTHSARTAVAATASLIAARALKLPDVYWAPISTLVVTQSTLGAAWTISRQRFIGTALGAALGALVTTYVGSSIVVFGVTIFGVGLTCASVHLDRSAYRFAGITLAIVMLAAHAESLWLAAIHRFVGVSVGIAVGLALTALWPEPSVAGA
jgi:uncharacterized membrane protein YgaE (UPF0421/DUF939 family)